MSSIAYRYLTLRLASFSKTKTARTFTHFEVQEERVIGRVFKSADYVHHYKNLPGNSFGLILKNRMAAMDISLMIIKEFCTF